MDHDRYEAMLAVADRVDPRMKLALVLANETGHRIASIRLLRWSDIDLQRPSVRWRAETDKMGREHETPLTEAAVRALEAERRRRPTVGDVWVFPSPEDPEKPCSRHLVRDWWYRAEELAGFEHVARMGWHSLRRKFATELKATPLKDLCALGGWSSHQTVLTCYQRPDADTMRAALASRQPLRSVGVA